MPHFKLGLVLEPLNLPVRAAIEKAAALGAQCVQFDAVGDLRPGVLSETGLRELRVKLKANNLELAALQVPLRRGLDVEVDQAPRIDHVQKAMVFAYELGARVVAVPCPKLPGEAEQKRAETLRESLLALAPFGDRIGVRLAVEGGLDPGEKLRDYLLQYDCGLGVAFDPANFLANGHDPLSALMHLTNSVIHLQARDVRTGTLSGGPKEVAVGAGEVDWITLMATLDAIGYQGAVVVDREDGQQRAADVESGLKFLRRFAGPQSIG